MGLIFFQNSKLLPHFSFFGTKRFLHILFVEMFCLSFQNSHSFKKREHKLASAMVRFCSVNTKMSRNDISVTSVQRCALVQLLLEAAKA